MILKGSINILYVRDHQHGWLQIDDFVRGNMTDQSHVPRACPGDRAFTLTFIYSGDKNSTERVHGLNNRKERRFLQLSTIQIHYQL